ncbi:olfactomedin-like [Anolis sagrei]|uniref:olfactomedin-like n=1 Tax=Anolis sagrei TaxID=38937 RepID=UPI003522C5B8
MLLLPLVDYLVIKRVLKTPRTWLNKLLETNTMFWLLLCLTVTSLVTADHIIFYNSDVAPRDGEGNECLCSLEIPEELFPSHMIDILEDAYENLTDRLKNDISKITVIKNNITEYTDKLKNLTDTIIEMETNGIKDDSDYQRVVKDINNLQKLIEDLTDRLNGTENGVEDLLNQVNNVSSMVWTLETFDQNGVLSTRRELASVRKQLAECEEAAGNPNFGLPSAGLVPPEFGKCDNKKLVNISKPFIVKLNWRGFSYKHGAWGKDFAVGNQHPGMFWVAPLNTDERRMETYRLYNSYTDMLLYKNQIEKSLSEYVGLTWNYANCGQGSGIILYNGSLYYNCYNTRNLCKLDVVTHNLKRKAVEGAAFNNWFSYSGVNWQDFDFSGDENGLWVAYATEPRKGKITVGKLDPETLDILEKWDTSLFRPNATNTFMICGVLYALKRVSAHVEKIFYSFDTSTGEEKELDITVEKLADTPQSVSYNPNDHKIYMYNDGYLVTYDVMFERRPVRKRRSVADRYESNAVIAISQGQQRYAMV